MIPTANITQWPDGSVDVSPLLPGRVVRIRERKVVQYDEKPRRGFYVSIDEGKNVSVLAIEHPTETQFLCVDHGVEDCDHKRVVRRYIKSDPT